MVFRNVNSSSCSGVIVMKWQLFCAGRILLKGDNITLIQQVGGGAAE